MNRIITNREKRIIPVIGKIKIGYKKANGVPTSTDYFIPTGNYTKIFYDQLGENPKEIEIIFPSDNLSQVCSERYEIRTTKKYDGVGGRLFGYGDGENFVIWSKENCFKEINIKENKDIMEQISKYLQTEWKIHLTLRFIITKIRKVLGLWQFDTFGAETSIPSIVDTFDFVKNEVGYISMIPFDLKVEKVKSQKVGSKNAFPIVSLIPKGKIKNEIKTMFVDENKILEIR